MLSGGHEPSFERASTGWRNTSVAKLGCAVSLVGGEITTLPGDVALLAIEVAGCASEVPKVAYSVSPGCGEITLLRVRVAFAARDERISASLTTWLWLRGYVVLRHEASGLEHLGGVGRNAGTTAPTNPRTAPVAKFHQSK